MPDRTEALAPPDGYALPAPLPWADLKDRARFFPRALVLEMCVRLALRVPGNIVEFGVADGSSTRAIRRALRRHRGHVFAASGRRTIFALDSFEGLRERFENADAGTFAGAVPRIPGVEFVKGYFEDTCTADLQRRVGRVAFAHLDADLYSSTLTALRWLTPLLDTGSILLFDEFVGSSQAEARAFDDWRHETGTRLIRIAELDRDPSGFGSTIDRRLVYQVIGDAPMPRRAGREQLARRLAYYAGRLGLDALRDRFETLA